MTDAEMIAALAGKLTQDELIALASRLNRKKPKEIIPTDEELAQFERLWTVRKQFTKRLGDPKRPALLAFCRRTREKPAPIEEIEHGIRAEYGAKKDDPKFYPQMETFMRQRRWESHDWAAVEKARLSPNIVEMRPRSNYVPAFKKVWEAQQEQKKQEA